MVIGAFPVAKLGVLLIKHISKPIANMIKNSAKEHPFFRRYVCIPPAQFYNWCEVKAKMWMLNLGRPVNIPVLSQEMATELGANLLGEAIILLIASGLLLIEYNRQLQKEAAKEAAKQAEMNRITSGITELLLIVKYHEAYLKELERILYSISGQKPDLPPREELKPPPTLTEPKGGASPEGLEDECLAQPEPLQDPAPEPSGNQCTMSQEPIQRSSPKTADKTAQNFECTKLSEPKESSPKSADDKCTKLPETQQSFPKSADNECKNQEYQSCSPKSADDEYKESKPQGSTPKTAGDVCTKLSQSKSADDECTMSSGSAHETNDDGSISSKKFAQGSSPSEPGMPADSRGVCNSCKIS